MCSFRNISSDFPGGIHTSHIYLKPWYLIQTLNCQNSNIFIPLKKVLGIILLDLD